MYVTRPLSLYKNSPEALSILPEGPNSGFLVLQDEVPESTTCFGFRECHVIKELPIPQNKDLSIRYVQSYGQAAAYVSEEAVFIPVLNQPLSSNLYYVIHQDGKYKGDAYTCSKEQDKHRNIFLVKSIKDAKPKPLDPNNVYQQIEIAHYKSIYTRWSGFHATSIAPDGIPPQILRNKGWDIKSKFPRSFRVGEALGLNAPLRARLPNFDFQISCKVSTPVMVGKWNCPFVFIKDGKVSDQMDRTLFYEMMLEQRWEQIYSCHCGRNQYPAQTTADSGTVNLNNVSKNMVLVDMETRSESVLVDGKDGTWETRGDVVWFNGVIGLDVAIIERMKWEQNRGGFRKSNKGNIMKVNRVEEFLGFGDWNEFGCYVLVERFVLKRMDGSLVLTYDFKHTHQIRSKWE